MRFRVTVVDRASGGRRILPVEAPDARVAGWAVLRRGMEVLAIDPEGAAMAARRPADSEAEVKSRPAPVSGYAIGSLTVCGATAFVSLLCVATMFTARELDGLAWLALAFIANFLGSVAGMVVALAGRIRGDSRKLVVHGIVCNLCVGAPSILIILLTLGNWVSSFLWR
jgi:hypothetical protein